VSNRSLAALGTNYVGLESQESAGSCVLSFASDGIGHAVADSCVEELRTNFRGDIWVHNGPGLITRVLLKICKCSRVSH
jgi:lactosylceramide 4-alpha-galactosyltransferase